MKLKLKAMLILAALTAAIGLVANSTNANADTPVCSNGDTHTAANGHEFVCVQGHWYAAGDVGRGTK